MTERLHGVVAMDGPSGTGKSTVSRRLATAAHAGYLDTGAMYRAVTLAVLRAGLAGTEPEAEPVALAAVEDVTSTTDPSTPAILLGGADVGAEIRGPEVTGAVSAVAAVPAVRRHLVAQQREIIAAWPRIVVEGRDIATVVAPNADLKVYLTASSAARARRRSAEDATDEAATRADLERRDRYDSSRAADPLQRAGDAVEVDTTGMGIDDVVARLLEMLNSRVNS